MSRRIVVPWVALAILVLVTGHFTTNTWAQKDPVGPSVYYMEIVCRDVSGQVAALEGIHGITFGPPVPELGQARVAAAPDGSRIGVRAPLAEHEQPIIRTYRAVDDIERAITVAEEAGAAIAYPPTRQGDTGTWAIYVHGGLQFGLWQP